MFYVFTVAYILYISVCGMKMMTALFQKTRTGNLLFPFVCVFVCESRQFPFYRLSGSIFLPAINCFCTVQKKGVSHRLHPFSSIPLQGFIWPFSSRELFLSTAQLLSNFLYSLANAVLFSCQLIFFTQSPCILFSLYKSAKRTKKQVPSSDYTYFYC